MKSILGRFWGGFGDGFEEDFGGPRQSWESKMEAGRQKKSDKKRKTKRGDQEAKKRPTAGGIIQNKMGAARVSARSAW